MRNGCAFPDAHFMSRDMSRGFAAARWKPLETNETGLQHKRDMVIALATSKFS